MQLNTAIPAVWVYTTGSAFNAARAGGYGAFLSDEQQARLERIRQARLLFDGKHREYFLDEQRTQYDFAPVRVGDRNVQLYLSYNVLGLISLKGADLLFGEEPLLRSDDEYQQAAIAALAERCNLHSLLYGCAVDASYEGECFLEACIKGGQVYLRQIPADEIFPDGPISAAGQYDRYVRLSVENVGLKDKPIWLLLEQVYTPGKIERKLWQLDDGGKKMGQPLALDQWPGFKDARNAGGELPAEVEVTIPGVNVVTWIPNLIIRGKAVSDYDGAIDLQDALNAKNSQVSRVLLKHSDPKMVFPAEAFDEKGNIRADADAFSFTDPNQIPKYITWTAELEVALKDRAFVLNQLLVRTETSPVLLGLKEGAAPDAYKKVRLESFNSLTKAARKAAYWKAGIRRAVGVAQDLEQTLPGVRYDRGPVAVELRDGIPADEKDMAERQAILRGAGLLSVRRSLIEQLKDPAAVEQELAELDEEAKANTPSSLLMDPALAGGNSPGGEQLPGGGQDQTDAVAGNDLRSTVGALNGIRDLQVAYYGGELPREACILNAMTMLGMSRQEAEALFPEVAPDAPDAPDAPGGGQPGVGQPGGGVLPFGGAAKLIALVLLLVSIMADASRAGVSGPALDQLVSIYAGTQNKLKAIILDPKGRTQGSKDYRRLRASQQLSQVETILAGHGRLTQSWAGTNAPAAYTNGLNAAAVEVAELRVNPAGSPVSASFSRIDRDAVEILARDIATDLDKANGALKEQADFIVTQTSQRAIDESKLNRILAGGIIEGEPEAAIRELRDALKAAIGDQISIPTRNGGTMQFDTAHYARLVAVTKTREVMEKARHNRFQQSGIDLVRVVGTFSGNFCTAYLGMVFSLSGGDSTYPSIDRLPRGGPPFHPFCGKSTRAFIPELASAKDLAEAAGLADASKLLGVSGAEAQRRFKDLQLGQQVLGGYAKGFTPPKKLTPLRDTVGVSRARRQAMSSPIKVPTRRPR
ncbi:phage portal protein [Humisphaera borealis]|uniref:Uncharacterized protein n=1 Tax=Humisphaera borealis TaxID=2807512 RepID=A0A7M2WZG7_9BACT|nr:hypothetical protein [Humisphaera borealis]QOV90898.1 hypothetical protein IPV69_05930 [Humisphaera borealis]